MNKLLILIAGLTLVSANVWASKARLTSLGQGENGSYYLNDNRNTFYNPATMQANGDYVSLESGTTALQPTGSPLAPNTTANAEGSFVKTIGDMKLGLHLGRETQTADDMSIYNAINGAMPAAAKTGTFLYPQNAFEIGLAGESSVKWGAQLLYANSDVKSTTPPQKSNVYGIRFGALTEQWGAYLNLGLGSDAKGVVGTSTLLTSAQQEALEYKGTTGYRLGGKYNLGDGQTVYLNYEGDGFKVSGNSTTDLDLTTAGVQNEIEAKGTNYDIGYAHVMDIDKMNRFFWAIAYQYRMVDLPNVLAASASKTETANLPITIGMEAEAASWMTLRASVQQSVLLASKKTTTASDSNTDTSPSNSTTVAMGAGLKFNKVEIDGTLAGSTTGNINAGSLLANASMTYSF